MSQKYSHTNVNISRKIPNCNVCMKDVSKLIYAKYGKDYSEVTKRTASRFQNASRICIQNVVEVQSVQIHTYFFLQRNCQDS